MSVIIGLTTGGFTFGSASAQSPVVSGTGSDVEPAKLHGTLTEALRLRESMVSVHAAESLIALGERSPVLDAFRVQAESKAPGYRCGVWRVLATAEDDPAVRESYIRKLRAVLADPAASDRVHAMESLAKIAAPIEGDAERKIVLAVSAGDEAAAPFALWRLAQQHDAEAVARLTKLLASADEVARLRAAYSLARLRPLPAATEQALRRALAAEREESIARPILICAVGGPAVRELARTATEPGARYQAAMALSGDDAEEDLGVLRALVDDPDADVRVGAAFALLRRGSRATSGPGSEPSSH